MASVSVSVCVLAVAFLALVHGQDSDMPPPFYRVLQYTVPMMNGQDVFIMQNLLLRSPYVAPSLQTDGIYGQNSKDSVTKFQVGLFLFFLIYFYPTTLLFFFL